jgi:hypothetical protein
MSAYLLPQTTTLKIIYPRLVKERCLGGALLIINFQNPRINNIKMSQRKTTLKRTKSILNRRRILSHKIQKVWEFSKTTININVEVLNLKMKELMMLSVLSLVKIKKFLW